MTIAGAIVGGVIVYLAREGAIRDRPDLVSECRRIDVDTNRLMTVLRERAHQGLAEVPCAAGDKDPHGQ